jgi:uncharacterized protein YndB with AHSA1/START domain
MRPVTVRTHISAPREEVFDLVADMATRVAWNDHFQDEFRLTRPVTYGQGSAARWSAEAPFNHGYVENAIVEFDRPRRIFEQLRMGRNNRVPGWAEYIFEPASRGVTRVELTVWTEPKVRIDSLKESFGQRGWTKRKLSTALDRLRKIFEEPPKGPLRRASVAGYEPWTAPRFGGHVRERGAG